MTRLRRTTAMVLALVPPAALAAAGILMLPKLGPVMASHWSGTGFPDDFSDPVSSFWIFAGITTVVAAASIVATASTRLGRLGRTVATVAVMLSGLVASAWVIPALATLTAPSPKEATLGGWMALLLPAFALSGLIRALVPSEPVLPGAPRAVAPVLLKPGERIAWAGTTGSALFTGIAATVILVNLGAGVAVIALQPRAEFGGLAGAMIGLLAGVSGLLLARVRLTIDHRGLRLVSAVFGVPLMRIPLSDVSSVAVEDIEPEGWGGWGLRFSPGKRAYVTGRGPGIVVGKQDGGAAAVTIRHADDAASVMQALIGR